MFKDMLLLWFLNHSIDVAHIRRFVSYASFGMIWANVVPGGGVGVVEYSGRRFDSTVSTGVFSAVWIVMLNLTFVFGGFGGSSLLPSIFWVRMSSISTVCIG